MRFSLDSGMRRSSNFRSGYVMQPITINSAMGRKNAASANVMLEGYYV